MKLKPFNPTSISESNNGTNQRGREQEAQKTNGIQEPTKEAVQHMANNNTTETPRNSTEHSGIISNEDKNMSGNVIILDSMEQGSNKWHDARRGCVTMSNAKSLISKGRKKGEPSVTRRSYLISVASEIITGVTAETFKSWQMERGNILEPFARDAYREYRGIEGREVGLGYLNSDRRISASPDELYPNHGMEIKCQMPKNHLNTIVNGFEPKEFDPQMQGCMWLFEKEYWEYVSFCPDFPEQPIFVHRVNRDEKMIKEIEESALQGVEEIDEFVRKGRDSEPSVTILGICGDALREIEALSYEEPEFI